MYDIANMGIYFGIAKEKIEKFKNIYSFKI